MYNLFIMETMKILKTNRAWVVSIVLSFFFALGIYLGYKQIQGNNHGQGNLLAYSIFMFDLNKQIVFPTLLAVFFAPIITEEFNLRTIYLLKGSYYKSEQWLFAKFLSGIFVFSLLFVFITVIGLAFCQFVILNSSLLIDAGGIYISVGETILRLVVTVISMIIFFISFAGFIMLISLITRHYLFTVLITFIIIVLYIFLPMPDQVTRYIFLYGQGVDSALGEVNFPWSHILNTVFVDLASTVIFLMISFIYLNKIEINR